MLQVEAEVVVEPGPPVATMGAAAGPGRKGSRRRRPQAPSCEACFFHCRGLCALDLAEPCSTFRPDSPNGLMPPRQPALLLEQTRQTQLAPAMT